MKDIHSHRTIPLKFTANIRTYAEKLRAKQLQLKQKTDHSSITIQVFLFFVDSPLDMIVVIKLLPFPIQETPDPRTTTNIDESQLEANLNEIFKPMYKIKVNDVFKDDDSKPKPLNPLLCTASKLSLPNKCRNFLDKSCFKDDQQLAAPTASETIPDHMNSSESASTTVIGKCDKFDMSSLSSQAYKNDVFKNVDQEISTITSRHVPCKQEALSNLLNECVVVNKGVEPSTVKEKSDIYAWNGDDIKDLKTKETQLKDPVKRKRVSTTKSRASLTDEENSSEPSRKKRKVPTNGCFSSTTLTKHNGRYSILLLFL